MHPDVVRKMIPPDKDQFTNPYLPHIPEQAKQDTAEYQRRLEELLRAKREHVAEKEGGKMRTFGTGATRNVDENKHDYEGFLSPLVLEGYGAYMHEHRVQADGTLRAADNWQKGIPVAAYRSSLIRHVFTAWAIWRGWPVKPEQVGIKQVVPTLKSTLYAILFNVMGYLHELEKEDLAKSNAAVVEPSAGQMTPLVQRRYILEDREQM